MRSARRAEMFLFGAGILQPLGTLSDAPMFRARSSGPQASSPAL